MTTPRDDDRTEALPVNPIPGTPTVRPTGAGPDDLDPLPGLPDEVPPHRAPDKVDRTQPSLGHTRTSGTWVAVLASIVVLLVLLIFILQNLEGATIYFLGASGTLPLGVALLLAAIAGALVVALVGAARIMQLRRQAKRGLR
ncbi:lipopolysaccharide assembly protein LapA domain-containing protein [Saccharothrix syringae]|uniref:DUF1049 domain-containing protein n=1 Tax=Saccharothrix syringae TaxID=103733 RepID=A0A5Q0GVB5_SACSY|nr:lipopolysaccharide assembly protein LapA domain-containing protein [Saccharothrix syringae]QFZ18056.1 DUF1049 domain-containing protein [Saccharothrix syringae]